MGRCSVSLLVTSLILILSVVIVPVDYVIQQGKEPMIRVKLSKNPKTFTLGATGKFNINEYASGKTLYSGEGLLQCSFSDAESMSFSIFVDTFYSREDATNFAKAMQTRFPEEVDVSIRADGELFRLEMGKYKSEEEAQNALDKYLSDIPNAVLVGSIGYAIRIGDKLVFRPPTNMELLNLVSIESTDGGLVKYRDKRYRGTITLAMNFADFYVVNKLLMEDYVKGVTPAEMPATWDLEAVKAQAICARTYAFRYNNPKKPAYDICNTTDCQVYIGYEHEHKNSNLAVEQTRGEVAVHNGKLIGAYFHATSGGMTENSENIWVEALPYIKGVDSPGEEISPEFAWMKIFTNEDFSTRIAKAGKKDIGIVYSWRVLERGVSPRVVKCEFTGTKGSVVISGGNTERKLGLNDRWFDVIFIPEKVVVVGHGCGHGLGMPQYGARARARDGMSYIQIMKYYYTGIEIEKWY